jgi:hypothetical protein
MFWKKKNIRVIDFDVCFRDPHPLFPDLTCTGVDTVRVEFDWDEKEDIMKAAVAALRKQEADRNYDVQYWWWVD